MKLFTVAATALLASTVSARSSWLSSGPSVSPNTDGSLSVPGENPLQHCQDPKDDVLTLESVDLDPNPPKAYVSHVDARLCVRRPENTKLTACIAAPN